MDEKISTRDSFELVIDKRDIALAMRNLHRTITNKNSESITNRVNFNAVLHDFLHDVLKLDVLPEIVDGISKNVKELNQMRILLIEMGFLASNRILPIVLNSIDLLTEKVDVVEHVLNEMLLIAYSLSQALSPDLIIVNEERQEELARKLIRTFNIGIKGETQQESRMILENLDSVEIQKLSSELEVKIRAEISEELRKRAEAAAAAAAKPSRE